ncbi:hypothetical protein NQ317_010075 [Molorchus minor]|uniref:Uncharacterized protein n=1 Tax=Molorchus minor TaxID=1323400 RepID=A0ABQ9J392_9CUCU|nr:hypothetical protein NQ317_010075 [Molorchus minor]
MLKLQVQKNPKVITCTRLRKHLATLTQLFDMTGTDIEQLAHFMGHTVGVHKGSYRLPNDVYQTAKIAKLLLLMEQGEAAEFKGLPLNEIQLDLEEDLMAENVNKVDKEHSDNKLTFDSSVENITSQKAKENIRPSSNTQNIQKKKKILVSWTENQKKIVKNIFLQSHQ